MYEPMENDVVEMEHCDKFRNIPQGIYTGVVKSFIQCLWYKSYMIDFKGDYVWKLKKDLKLIKRDVRTSN